MRPAREDYGNDLTAEAFPTPRRGQTVARPTCAFNRLIAFVERRSPKRMTP
jgi:hypothetical protein